MVAYFLLILIGIYGWSQFKIDFVQEWLIGEDAYVFDFYALNEEYFKLGYQTTLYVDDPDLDYSSKEIQLQLM